MKKAMSREELLEKLDERFSSENQKLDDYLTR